MTEKLVGEITKSDGGWKVDSASDPSKKYSVEMEGHGKTWYCTCEDFKRKIIKDPDYNCKHIIAVRDAFEASDIPSQKQEKEDPIPFGGEKEDQMKSEIIPKVKPEFIENIKGKDFVKYVGVLDLTHQKGYELIDSKIVQLPTKENGMSAICEAFLYDANGKLRHHDYGEARPENVNKMVVHNLLLMASTRAKARVMRDYTNVGITCLEELGNIPKAPTPKQMEKLIELLKAKRSKNIPDAQLKEIHKWITNLTRDELLLVTEKIEGYDMFDFNSYITLKEEVDNL